MSSRSSFICLFTNLLAKLSQYTCRQYLLSNIGKESIKMTVKDSHSKSSFGTFKHIYLVNWGLVVWVHESGWEGLHGWKIFAKAGGVHSLGMLAGVVVLHWVRVWDYSSWYFVYYQQTVSKVSLCGFVFLFVLFIIVFVLCVMGQKTCLPVDLLVFINAYF